MLIFSVMAQYRNCYVCPASESRTDRVLAYGMRDN
jgi:hypothetical protein